MGYDGLVMSGGAAKGAAFLGALDKLRADGQLDDVKTIAGSSIGALVAVLVAQKADMRGVLDKMAGRPFNVQCDLTCMEERFGLDDGDGLLRFARSLIGTCTFRELRGETDKNVVVCVTDLLRRRPAYLSADSHPDLEVAQAVRMSCTLPFLFGYSTYQGVAYVDGGISDNFPVAPVVDAGCSCILGLRFRDPPPTERPSSLMDFSLAMMASAAHQSVCKDSLCERVVSIEVEAHRSFDFSMSRPVLQRLFEVGRGSISSE